MQTAVRAITSLILAIIAGAAVAALGVALLLNLPGWSATAGARTGGAFLLVLAPIPLLLASIPRTKRGNPGWLRAISGVLGVASGLVLVGFAGLLAFMLFQSAQRAAALEAVSAAAKTNEGLYASSVQYAEETKEPVVNAVAWYTVPGGVLVDVFVLNAPFNFDFDAVKPSSGEIRDALWIEPRTMIEGTADISPAPVQRFVAYVTDADKQLTLLTPVGEAAMPGEPTAAVPPQLQALRIYPR